MQKLNWQKEMEHLEESIVQYVKELSAQDNRTRSIMEKEFIQNAWIIKVNSRIAIQKIKLNEKSACCVLFPPKNL